MTPRSIGPVPWLLAMMLAGAVLVTAGRYGIFRDELYYLACAAHLDFGYVDHPPMVALLTRLETAIFGTSARGLRVLPAVAGALTVLLAARLARDLGGGRFAAGLSALAVVGSTALTALFGFMSMNAFDILWVTLALAILLRILNRGDPRLWIGLGVVAGVGLETKLTMLILGFAAAVALLVTRERRHLATRWPYLGGLLALLIWLPHLVWQAAHGWPTLEFMRNAQQLKIVPLSPHGFLLQMIVGFNPVMALLWIGGLVFLLFSRGRSERRVLGLTFVIFLVVFLVRRSKFYYVAPAIPLLLAAGAVAWERLAMRAGGPVRRVVMGGLTGLLVVATAGLMPLALPVLSIADFVAYNRTVRLAKAIKMERGIGLELPQHFSDRFGWPEMVAAVAEVYRQLPPGDRARAVIVAGNYGQAGAIDHFGRALGLPHAISGHNSYWLWGPPEIRGEPVIAIGIDRKKLERYFGRVEHVGTARHRYAVHYETNRPIYVCRDPKVSPEELRRAMRSYI